MQTANELLREVYVKWPQGRNYPGTFCLKFRHPSLGYDIQRKLKLSMEINMQTITIPQHTTTNFAQARQLAVGKANEMLTKPVIVAWKDDQNGKFAPEIPGGTGDRWHDYGESKLSYLRQSRRFIA